MKYPLKQILMSLAIVAACAAPVAAAEPGDAGGLESTKDYKDTQDVINKTQAKIDQLNRDNAQRTKELNAVVNRVNDALSTMSSQGSDNTNLRSEMTKLTAQLEQERETTKALRSELTKANAKTNANTNVGREKDLEEKLRASDEARQAAEKRLAAALESIAGQAQANRQLVADKDNLQKDLDAARKDNDLLRRLRSSNPSQPLPK